MQIATDAIDRLHTTAESHDRVMVVEVMGRHAGWIAMYSGLAGGADVILVPEEPFDIDEVCERIEHRHRQRRELLDRRRRRGRGAGGGHDRRCRAARSTSSATCASAGSATVVAEEIERRTGFETRVTILGHVLRGGTPTAYDRVLATRFGIAAIDAVHDGDFGTMVALRGDRHRPRADRRRGRASSRPSTPSCSYDVASVFFG